MALCSRCFDLSILKNSAVTGQGELAFEDALGIQSSAVPVSASRQSARPLEISSQAATERQSLDK
jgi:hypothetical protein